MAETWFADALRAGGCRVDETPVPDWKSRGHVGAFTPRGVLLHHTAGAATGDLPSLRIVRDGRPGLAGPLAHLMLSRAGVWVPIAAGLAWHAGDGSAPWVPGSGNRYLIGIEAESCGTRDDWTPEQREAYPLGVAALCRRLGVGADRVIGHKEWAPRRKVDPAFWDLDDFRARVAAHLRADSTAAVPVTTTSGRDPDPMALIPLLVTPERTFRAAFMVEAGAGSQAVDHAWITIGSTWGASTMTVTVMDAAGRVLLRRDDIAVANNRKDYVEVPDGAALATIEGTVETPATLPAAALVCTARA